MIQGIRITSENLSGLTANVTFLSATGGTIDLGVQTVPFNNIGYAYGTPAMGLDYLTGMGPSKGYADGGRIGFKAGSGKKILSLISKPKKPIKEFTDDEMIAYIKKYINTKNLGYTLGILKKLRDKGYVSDDLRIPIFFVN